MKSELDTVFEDFIERIVLTRTQRNRIDSTVESAKKIFNQVDVRLQGSFATGTTVKPLTESASNTGTAGEYDADIALLSNHWDQPIESLDAVMGLLHDSYGDKIDTDKKHNSCERVYFAEETTGVAFHADYVPLKRDGLETYCCNRKKETWQPSPTFEVIENYVDFSKENPYASSCLLILKRLRDYKQYGESIPSIVLLTLVRSGYSDNGSYVNDLMGLLEYMIDILGNNKSIIFYGESGAKLTEELQDKIKNVHQVKNMLNDFLVVLKRLTLFNLSSMEEYLSSDFPSDSNDFPIQMESLRSHDFSYDTLNGLELVEVDSAEHGSRFFKRYHNAMHFTQNVSMKLQPPNQRDLNSRKLNARWRITNDPSRVPDEVRGRLMPREKNNEFIRKETAQYDGLHRAELFAFRQGSKKITAKGRYRVKKVANL